MPLSPLDLAGAKDVIESLLAQLDLDAVLFAVEHNTRGWELRVECAASDGWLVETIPLGEELPAPAEAALRDRLLTLLREKLCDCKPSA